MSYNITLRTYQTNTNAYFRPVEFTNFNAIVDFWSRKDEEHILTMGGSGDSGSIRFFSDDTNESFLAVVGVHNGLRWCDIVPNLTLRQAGTVLNPQYYDQSNPKAAIREKQLAACTATNSRGRALNLKYTITTGNNLKANIVIG